MKVYVAASSHEMPRARAVMNSIRKAGHTITHDWVSVIEAVGSANPENATREECRGWALEDLKGASDADVLVILGVAKGTGQGAFTEFGYVLGLRAAGQFMRRTIGVKVPACHSIFLAMADVLLDSDAEIVESINELERQR